MTIITITNLHLLPDTNEYAQYTGTLEACRAEFAKKYPAYTPPQAYYYAPGKSLFVPMDYHRVFDVAKP